MRSTYFFAIVLMSCLFFSCNNSMDSDLVGTWAVVETTCDDGLTISYLDGEEFSRTDFTYFWDNIENTTFVLNSDNTNTNSGSYTQVLTAQITTNSMVFSPQTSMTDIVFTSSSDWELDEDELIFTNSTGTTNGNSNSNSEPVVYKIVNMTSETMELSSYVEIENTQIAGGVTVMEVGTQTINILLEKQ